MTYEWAAALLRTLVVLGAVSVASPALGEAAPPILPGQQRDLGTRSPDPIVITTQLRAGLRDVEMAVRQLNASQELESFRDAAAWLLSGYRKIRDANDGMGLRIARQRNFRNPVFEWESKTTTTARLRVNRARAECEGGRPNIEKIFDHLNVAIPLIKQVLASVR